MASAEHIGKVVFQVMDAPSSNYKLSKRFKVRYGQGVSVKWGLDMFRQFMSSDETPPYVLAMGKPIEGKESSEFRPRSIITGQRRRPNLNVSYRAPSTEMESDLVGLWKKILGVALIGVDDDFFDLGGDSIEAVQV